MSQEPSSIGLSSGMWTPMGTPAMVSSGRQPKLACTKTPTVYVSPPSSTAWTRFPSHP